VEFTKNGTGLPITPAGSSQRAFLMDITPTVGITEFLDALKFKIYPNPTKEKLNIGETEKDIFITNSLGQSIYSAQNVKNEIDVGFLSAGIYYLTLKNKNGSSVVKLVKE